MYSIDRAQSVPVFTGRTQSSPVFTSRQSIQPRSLSAGNVPDGYADAYETPPEVLSSAPPSSLTTANVTRSVTPGEMYYNDFTRLATPGEQYDLITNDPNYFDRSQSAPVRMRTLPHRPMSAGFDAGARDFPPLVTAGAPFQPFGSALSQGSFDGITYSRHYKRTFADGDRNRQTSKEVIPTFSRESLRNILRTLRSHVLNLLQGEDTFSVLRYLSYDERAEDEFVNLFREMLAEFGFYNNLLNMFEDGWRPRRTYVTDEDQFDQVESLFDTSADVVSRYQLAERLPPTLARRVPGSARIPVLTALDGPPLARYPFPERVGQYSMKYYPGRMEYVYRANTRDEDTASIPYRLSEAALVETLRRARKYFDNAGDKFMFAFFHNLLAPFVFPSE